MNSYPWYWCSGSSLALPVAYKRRVTLLARCPRFLRSYLLLLPAQCILVWSSATACTPRAGDSYGLTTARHSERKLQLYWLDYIHGSRYTVLRFDSKIRPHENVHVYIVKCCAAGSRNNELRQFSRQFSTHCAHAQLPRARGAIYLYRRRGKHPGTYVQECTYHTKPT